MYKAFCGHVTDVGPGLCAGEEYRPLADLCKSLKDDWSTWLEWVDSADPITAPIHPDYQDKVNPFQRLILIRAFREEKLLLAVQNYVSKMLGPRFGESPSAKMEDIYRDMDNKTPCIFILSTGADPTGMLLRFAREMGYADKLSLVSLGQGQGPYATELIDKGTKSGNWVLLQNCMLAKSWMPSLEKIVFALGENSPNNHKDFRLYLTSAPARYFPVSILQNGVKMTNEPPKGVRANVLRSVGNLIKEEYWESCTKAREWKKLLCGLCFFHANIQERRKFGPLGWNIRYAFDESDLETSIAILRRFLEEQDDIPWDALRFVTGQINYGGRVTDDWDRRCLMSILGYYITPKILEDDYRFSKSSTYYAPKPVPIKKLLDYFGSLPTTDNPIYFGMHDNANVTFQTTESQALMATILGLQPRTSGGGGEKSSDETVLDMAKEIAAQVPAVLDTDEAGPTTFVIQENGLLGSLAIVLAQEMVKFNRLLTTMTSTLADLQKAIKGFIVMTLDLDRMYTSFLTNKVPGLWLKVSFASLKSLASWVKDLIYRIDFMRTWLRKGQPAAFSLPVFFFPQGFMTGEPQALDACWVCLRRD
jgi:dynein heavy chain, axonemal